MPRKKVKEQKSKDRISPILKNLIGTEKPDDLMDNIKSVLSGESVTPITGNSYTFTYYKKTPNIRYDQYPLVTITSVEEWGFRGFNYHWNGVRQYTWNEIQGSLYPVTKIELDSLRKIPYAKIIKN